jgi:CRP-like cAMP-binding protein
MAGVQTEPPRPSLKSLPGLATLSSAEAAVFDRLVASRDHARGDVVEPGGSVLVVLEGTLRLVTAGGDGTDITLARLDRGALLGESALFAPEPHPLRGVAESRTVFLELAHRALMTSFHYSRSAAAKFMVACARELSRKIRDVNEVLHARRDRPLPDEVELLRAARLGDRDVARIKAFTESRNFAKGEVVFRQGDQSRELYVIDEGELEICKDAPPEPPMPLALLGRGDFFGEMAFVDRRPRSAAALARTDLRLQVLEADTFERVLDVDIGVALYLANLICKIMTRRLDVTLRRLAAS